MKFAFIIAITIYYSQAMADIIFLDLNYVSQELKVVQEEAKKRGEKVIVIPQNREEINKVNAPYLKRKNENMAFFEKNSKCWDDNNSDNGECKKIKKQHENASNEIEKIPHKILNRDDFIKLVSQIPEGADTLMISGHDGGGNFSGDLAVLSSEDFKAVFKDAPLSKGIRNLFLLGCQSASKKTLGPVWKNIFPESQFIAGYENIGFLRENPKGHDFIRGLLNNRDKINSSKSMRDALNIFMGLSPREKKYQTAACVAIDKQGPFYLSASGESKTFEELYSCYDKEKAEKIFGYLNCYSNREKCSFADFSKVNTLKISDCIQKNNSLSQEQKDKMIEQFWFLSNWGKLQIHDPKKRNDFEDNDAVEAEYFLHLKFLSSKAIQSLVKAELKDMRKLSYFEFLDKIKSIKDKSAYYPTQEAILEVDPKKYQEQVNLKIDSDNLWLAYSNFDMDRLMKLTTNDFVDLNSRANQYAQSVGMDKEKIKERIEAIKKFLSKPQVGDKKDILQMESDRLSVILSEIP